MSLPALLTSSLVCFCAGSLYGWSALIAPVQALYGVSTAQTGLVFSLAIASFTAAVILTPQLPMATSTPRAVAGFGVFGATCVVAATQAQAYLPFLFWFSGGFGAASGGIYITALGVAAAAPAHKRATPAMVASFGTGGAIFGPVWRVMDAHGCGLDGLLLLGIGLAVSAALATLPAPPVKTGNGPPRMAPLACADRSKSGRSLMVLWAVFACGSFGGLMVLGLASKMMDTAQINVKLASLSLAAIAIGNTTGRLSVAILFGYLRLDQCLFLAMALTLCGLISAAFHAGPVMLCAGLVLVAMGYGIVASTVPAATRAIFGAASFQGNFSIVFTAWGVAGFLAPWVGGALFDGGSSFRLPLLISALATALCCVMIRQLKSALTAQERRALPTL